MIHTTDLAVADEQQLAVSQLERFLDDMRLQPQWRREADKACDWYDGNQLDAQMLQRMERLGIPPVYTNLIAPTVDLVLGMEAKTRSDPRVESDDEPYQEIAEAQSQKLIEWKRETNADKAISDAYAEQIKAGLGWVYVGRNFDPFRYPHLVEHVPRNEMWWDWHAKPDMSNARWLIRRKWYDKDFLVLAFPRHAQLISGLIGMWSKPSWDPEFVRNYQYGQSLDLLRSFRLDQAEWMDSQRERLCLYEVWYRVWVRGHVLKLPSGRVVQVDVHNPRHAQAILAGMVQPYPALFDRVRRAYWIGPWRLEDHAHTRNHFPYVPFWAKREDKSGAPYGVIRAMFSPQEEANARLSKAMWMLASKRVTATDGAVKDPDRARRELARPDAWIELDKNFDQHRHVFRVEDNGDVSAQQLEIMRERMHAINQAAGIFQPMLGDAKSGQSGLAITSLVEQGVTTLAEINDNYRSSRRQVFEYGLEEITFDLAQQRNVAVRVKKPGKVEKTVMLNVPAQDDFGEYLENDVSRALIKVGLADVPSTPAYRAQMLMMLSELAKALPPQLQAFLVPFIMRASDAPDRHEIADAIGKALGMGQDGQPPDPRLEQAAMQIQQLQELVGKLQGALGEAEQAVRSKEADVGLRRDELELRRQEVEQRRADAEQRAQVEAQRSAIDARARELDQADKALSMAERVAGMNAPEVAPIEQSIAPLVEQLRKEVDAQIKQVAASVEKITKEASSGADKVESKLLGEIRDLRQHVLTVISPLSKPPIEEKPINITVPVTIEGGKTTVKEGTAVKTKDGYKLVVKETRAD